MRVRHDAVDNSGIAGGCHIVLSTLVATVRVTWMVGMVGGSRDHTRVRTRTGHRCSRTLCMMIHLVLLRPGVAACIVSCRVACIATVRGIVLLA